jgi:hypothetical protein
MFPIEGEKQEMGKHFNNNFPYRGVRLRPKIQRHSRTVQKKQLKPKTWVFSLYATYLFVNPV